MYLLCNTELNTPSCSVTWIRQAVPIITFIPVITETILTLKQHSDHKTNTEPCLVAYWGGGVTSVYVRLCPVLFGFYETTDVVFGTLADIDGHWRTWTDIGGLGRTLADSDGHWRTQTDIGGLRRTRVAKVRPAFRDRITKGNP